MSLGDSFPAELIRRQLQPGKIVHLECGFAGKPKFIVAACISPGPHVLVINSKINNFVANTPDLARCQVKIDQASHSFLSQDSWVACHEVVPFDLGDMHAQIESEPDRLKCSLSDDVKNEVIAAIKYAPTISGRVKNNIIGSLSD